MAALTWYLAVGAAVNLLELAHVPSARIRVLQLRPEALVCVFVLAAMLWPFNLALFVPVVQSWWRRVTGFDE